MNGKIDSLQNFRCIPLLWSDQESTTVKLVCLKNCNVIQYILDTVIFEMDAGNVLIFAKFEGHNLELCS